MQHQFLHWIRDYALMITTSLFWVGLQLFAQSLGQRKIWHVFVLKQHVYVPTFMFAGMVFTHHVLLTGSDSSECSRNSWQGWSQSARQHQQHQQQDIRQQQQGHSCGIASCCWGPWCRRIGHNRKCCWVRSVLPCRAVSAKPDTPCSAAYAGSAAGATQQAAAATAAGQAAAAGAAAAVKGCGCREQQ
jgi:hypothetical protein